jgi:hypothetical protein
MKNYMDKELEHKKVGSRKVHQLYKDVKNLAKKNLIN